MEDESYRPIHLIAALAKVFASVVEGKLSEWVARTEEQFGFEKGHGARDNVLVASAVFEKYAKVGVHCCLNLWILKQRLILLTAVNC